MPLKSWLEKVAPGYYESDTPEPASGSDADSEPSLSARLHRQWLSSKRRLQSRRRRNGFVILAHPPEHDPEANLILAEVFREAQITSEGEPPYVWAQPSKAYLRELARTARRDAWRGCADLVASPRLGRKGGERIWDALERFRIPEEEKVALKGARGWWCFTEVPVGFLGGQKIRARLERRLRRDGNVEVDGGVWAARMGRMRRRCGRVVGCMPCIRERVVEDGGEGEGSAEECLSGEVESGEESGGGESSEKSSEDEGYSADEESEGEEDIDEGYHSDEGYPSEEGHGLGEWDGHDLGEGDDAGDDLEEPPEPAVEWLTRLVNLVVQVDLAHGRPSLLLV